ncbi:MAG: HD domain-containing protein [Polyangiales bacterium]
MILRDPVHDLVAFEAAEEEIVPALLGTREVQRLRRIRQLGVTHLVFPGAEHSRFTHAIGATHVMTRLVRRLRDIHESLPFWQRLTSDRARDALAAALLHDVGHGPYSHLFEEAVPGARPHEDWSLEIVRDPSTEVHRVLAARDGSLPEQVASLIQSDGARKYPLPYLAHAVSGTFDVDRCDYLLRDAHMTGVRYGLFDLDWLLRSLRFGAPMGADDPHDAPRLAIDGLKGIAAIEGFLLGRRFMYEQVYLHKATRAAETMVKAIFARAAQLTRDGDALEALPPAMGKATRGEPVTLGEYLALDDTSVGAALAAWESARDPVLADLSSRLRNRRLGKTIELIGAQATAAGEATALEIARALARERGFDPALYVALDVASDSHGEARTEEAVRAHDAEDPLQVVVGDGRVVPLVTVSSLISALEHAPIRRVRLIVPDEIRPQVREELARVVR